MKRGLLALAVFFSAAAVFAGDVTHAYLVGTRRPARESLRQISRDDVTMSVGRNVEAFDIVDAFKTELTDAEAAALTKSPEVLYVEPDIPRHAFGAPHQTATNELRNPNGQTIPYGVYMVNAPSIWPATRGSSVNVAVLDTGIDVNHPDLQAAYAGGFNTFKGETAVPIDDEGHGTHVAGTVAATDNNIGVVGVAPGVRLWAVRVLRSDGKGSASGPNSNIIAGIQWVMQQKKSLGGNWIISMSLGSCMPSTTEASAVSSAINAGILLVVAAGNHVPDQADVCSNTTDNSYHVDYPAAYPGVVAVAAVDSSGRAGDFSNFGPQVAVSAPGVDVLSTVRLGTGSISYVDMSAGSRLASIPLIGSPVGTLAGTFVNCGLGKVAGDFPASVNGNIALIQRGDITFATKVKNAQAAGATAVIIYNKDSSGEAGFTLTADTADAGHVWPLTVAVSLGDGQALLAQPSKSATIVNAKDDYDNFQGTSMATPHVSAVAALAWSMAPSATAAAVKQALQQSAHDLGDPGVDSVYGYGLVDAVAAAKVLNPGAVFPVPTLGRSAGRRGH